ncbi:MAG: HDIG domain-containing protein, partial [Syntrophales bacterium]|nr:HDIG domain-containing protein [Syntrophales bacterium]
MKAEPIHIPSEEHCRRIIAELGMLENIVAHSLQVCRVSLLLTDQLSLPGLNRELIRAAALLHDVTKTRSFNTGEDHAETGARLLMDLGYPEVAGIVGQHVR